MRSIPAVLSLVLVANCGGGTTSTTPKQHTVHRRGDCLPEREDGSYHLDAAQAGARRGASDRRFGDTVTTQRAPIQACGLHGVLTWLTRVTCAGGSKPWGEDFNQAHAGRKGSAMENLLSCDKPVDLYIAPCPERAYEIFLDMYHCGPHEELWRSVDLGAPT